MDEQIQFPDLTFRLSQKWNDREKKFGFFQHQTALNTQETESAIALSNESLNEDLVVDTIQQINSTNPIQKPESQDENIADHSLEQTVSSSIVKEVIFNQTQDTLNDFKVEAQENNLPLSGFHAWLHNKSLNINPQKTVIKAPKTILKPSKPIKNTPGSEVYTELNPASETLAKLLISQGYKEEAISMYEKLSAMIPEKKDIFADLIKKLKN